MYDVRVHVPQRIETLLEAYNNADIELFESTVRDIKEMVTDQDFSNDIADYEKERDNQINESKRVCRENIRAIDQSADRDDQFFDQKTLVEEKLVANIEEAMSDYMLQTKTYIISYIKNIPAS